MKKRKKRKAAVVAGAALVAAALAVWMCIPYSPAGRQFQKDVSALFVENRLSAGGELFSADDFSHLPSAVRQYIEHCGYIGTPKPSWLKMEYRDVAFLQGRNAPALKISYTQYNFANEPCRMAFIAARLFGVPFEGCDYYRSGRGGMKGVFAKAVPLFNQTGADMDKACLATFLAEILFVPSALLQDYVVFEETDGLEVRAEIAYGGQTARGMFTFNERHEMVSFFTEDRAAAGADGSMEYVPWTALCSDYRRSEDGVLRPTKFQAVWKYPDGDFVYFDGGISGVSYGY